MTNRTASDYRTMPLAHLRGLRDATSRDVESFEDRLKFREADAAARELKLIERILAERQRAEELGE